MDTDFQIRISSNILQTPCPAQFRDQPDAPLWCVGPAVPEEDDGPKKKHDGEELDDDDIGENGEEENEVKADDAKSDYANLKEKMDREAMQYAKDVAVRQMICAHNPSVTIAERRNKFLVKTRSE